MAVSLPHPPIPRVAAVSVRVSQEPDADALRPDALRSNVEHNYVACKVRPPTSTDI
jgi:hypothetical protein